MAETVKPQSAPPPVAESTRLLCAAAYLDKKFADDIVSNVLEQQYRAVAPSWGVDVVAVVRHCLTARLRRLVRDTALVVLLAAWPWSVIAGGSPLGVALRVLLLGWGVVFVAACLDRYQVMPSLQRGRFQPNTARAPTSARDARLLRELHRDSRGNITVYSGFSPFVGSGAERESWSFTTNTQKGKEELGTVLTPTPFKLEELYNFLTVALRRLDIDRLTVESRLFVHGQDIRDLRWILPDQLARPRAMVDEAWVRHFMLAPTQQVRHYLLVQAVDWGGELVVSMFLRFARTGVSMLSEMAYFVMPPLQEKYYKVDRLRPRPDARGAMTMIGKTAVTAPVLLLLSPFSVGRRVLLQVTRAAERSSIRRQIKADPMFDYGAITSVRERGMSEDYRRYFQKLDYEMYAKLIEHRILESIIEFLDIHSIDTSDIKERRTNLLNMGLIVSGGSIQAGSIAVGAGAQARALPALRSRSGHTSNQPAKSRSR